MLMSPKTFWKMSLREWSLALEGYIESRGGEAEPEHMSGDDLRTLMDQYPDKPEEKEPWE